MIDQKKLDAVVHWSTVEKCSVRRDVAGWNAGRSDSCGSRAHDQDGIIRYLFHAFTIQRGYRVRALQARMVCEGTRQVRRARCQFVDSAPKRLLHMSGGIHTVKVSA